MLKNFQSPTWPVFDECFCLESLILFGLTPMHSLQQRIITPLAMIRCCSRRCSTDARRVAAYIIAIGSPAEGRQQHIDARATAAYNNHQSPSRRCCTDARPAAAYHNNRSPSRRCSIDARRAAAYHSHQSPSRR